MSEPSSLFGLLRGPARAFCELCGNRHGDGRVEAQPKSEKISGCPAVITALKQMAESIGIADSQVPTEVTPPAMRTFVADVVDASRASLVEMANRRVAERLSLTREALALGDAGAASEHFERMLELLSNDGTGVELR